jgi:hypothetical protein
MRTTFTLDPDVERLLREEMDRTQQSLTATLNKAIRCGLAGIATATDEQPFRVHARAMGLRTGIDPTKLEQTDVGIELDEFLRVTRQIGDSDDNAN